MKASFTLLSMMILLSAESARPQWIQTSGPAGGSVRPLATIGSELIATSGATIFNSTDYGSTWKRLSTPAPSSVYSFFVNASNLYAGTNHGVFLSTDKGSSWNDLNNGQPTNYSVFCIEAIGANLFTGGQVVSNDYSSWYGTVYRSTNQGLTWIAVLTIPYGNVSSLLAHGAYLFAGTSDGGIFRSSDNGTAWSKVKNEGTESMAANSSAIIAATGEGLVRSLDEGANWITTDTSAAAKRVNYIAGIDSNLFAGTRGYGVLVSRDSGNSWREVRNGLPAFYPDMRSIAIVSDENGTKILAGLLNNGVFRSTDLGTNWSEANNGLVATYVSGIFADGPNLLAATEFNSSSVGRIFRSTDNGNHWITPDTVAPAATCFMRKGINLFAGTLRGMIRSSDSGARWTELNNGLPALSFDRIITSVAVIGDNVFAAMGRGVFLSIDDGANWSPVNNGLTELNVFDLASIGTNLFAATFGNGVFRTTDNGQTWVAVNSSLSYPLMYSLAVKGTTLFVGEASGGESVFRSTDYGNSWSRASTGIPSGFGVTKLLANGVNLFASVYSQSSPSGVYVSTDDGANWKAIDMGLPAGGSLAANDQYLFVGMQGVWRRPLAEITSVGETPQSNQPETFSLSQNYPNPFNPSTQIRFEIPVSGFVSLKVFDLLGRQVATLVNEQREAGSYSLQWNGAKMPSGVYFYRLEASAFTETKKLILLR